MTERDVVVRGLRLRVREAGAGPAMVLVHGLGADRRIWEGTMAAFAGRHRVVALDLPGHGESDKPDADYTPDYFADVVRGMARALGIDEAVLVGTSLGGRIALEIAATYPDWAHTVVLSAPAPIMGGAWTPPVGWALANLTSPLLLRWLLPRGIERGFFDPECAGARLRRSFVAEQLARKDFPDFARAVARAVAGIVSGAPPDVARVRQPMLLLWGRHDRIVEPSGATALLAELPSARLRLLDRCGHMPMLEQPDAFHAALDEFLAAVAAGTPSPAAASGGM